MLALSTVEVLVDRRANNRGGAKHAPYANEYKASVIEFWKRSNLTVAEFANLYHLSYEYSKYLSKEKTGWREPDRKG